jgi:ribosomal protein S19
MEPIETIDLSKEPLPTGIDLSKEPLPTGIADREFDQKFLGNAINYLKDIRDRSADYVVDPRKIQIKEIDDAHWSMMIETPDGIKILEPTNYAHNQTIGRTALPKRYHDDLVNAGHINEAVNHLNMWIHEDEKKMHQIRTVGDQYRADVSPGYNPMDNYDLFITTAGAVKAANMMRSADQKPILYYKAQVSDANLYLHFIDEGREWDLGKGDTYKPMIIVKNSEVGDGALSVTAGLWRSMCSNLQLHGVISRKIHHGEKLEEGFYSPDTRFKQGELWKAIVRDAINAGIASDVLYEEILSGLRETKDIDVNDPIETVRLIKKQEKLSDADEQAIIKAMMGDTTVLPEDKNTLFNVVNGITQAAKTAGIENGIKLQELAGDTRRLMKIVA